MKRSILLTTIFVALLSLISCNNDDNGFAGVVIRDREPQNILDERFLNAFLENYTYNDIFFENDATSTTDHKAIEFFRIRDNNGVPITLSEDQQKVSTGISLKQSNRLGSITVNEFGINYKLYYIVVREGEGKQIAISDDILTSFEGSVIGTPGAMTQSDASITISENVFNEIVEPNWLIGYRVNQNNNGASILEREVDPRRSLGLSQLQSKFKTAELINPEQPCNVALTGVNGDVGFANFGLGILIIPSGMAFYESSIAGTPLEQYSNVIYTFSLFNNVFNDLDNDNIPDLDEGVNETNIVNAITIDTDDNGIQNFLDGDDDGDGRLTVNEIELTDLNTAVDFNCDGVVDNDSQLVTPFKDDNNNGIPNYLDSRE